MYRKNVPFICFLPKFEELVNFLLFDDVLSISRLRKQKMMTRPKYAFRLFSSLIIFTKSLVFILNLYYFCRQINRDCEFLEAERIMDYSLLVGVHFRDKTGNGIILPPTLFQTGTYNNFIFF